MFEYCTCEMAGVSSEKVLGFLQHLENLGLSTHSVLMARGNKLFAECHYAPFDKNFQHRMYSVSKSFISMAVGLAYTQGLIDLDCRITDFFPEHHNSRTDELYRETTIRDMLTMRSNIAGFEPWWGKYDNRISAYYAQESQKIPGTVYFYDSMGSYLLGCIVEKLTGKTFLEYLKDSVLCEMGFSKESRTLYAPGGYTIGDSGVICTAHDLLVFAKFVMDGGVFRGKRYIDESYMREAVSFQSYCNTDGAVSAYKSCGYGYLIWKMPDDGFAFIGMGDQLAVCDVKHDFIFVMTADNQANESISRELIIDRLYFDIISHLSPCPLTENPDSAKALCDFTDTRKLISIQGKTASPMANGINGKEYITEKNSLGINSIMLKFENDGGTFEYRTSRGTNKISFGICNNVTGRFPGQYRNSDTAGKLCEGTYDCASSGAWVCGNIFHIKVQIIDTYFGCLNIQLAFKDSRVTVFFKKSGQYILDEFKGYINGKQKESADNE